MAEAVEADTEYASQGATTRDILGSIWNYGGNTMTRSLGNTVADSLDLCLGYTDRLMTGITSEQFARFANAGGQVIESNHPAFILGHLSLYAPRVIEQVGRDDLAVAIPEKFDEVFSKDAKCVDDPDGSIYPGMDAVTEFYKAGYKNASIALREVDDAVLQQPNPNEPMASKFPTIGSMHAFYVGGHMMMHLGQLSAWRRVAGLGSA